MNGEVLAPGAVGEGRGLGLQGVSRLAGGYAARRPRAEGVEQAAGQVQGGLGGSLG
jgi:hypothetical protein